MAIRRGNTRLNRLCKKCGKLFEPSGKYTTICNDCHPRVNSEFILGVIKMQKKRKREEKLKEKLKLINNANKTKKNNSEVPKFKDFKPLKGKLEKEGKGL